MSGFIRWRVVIAAGVAATSVAWPLARPTSAGPTEPVVPSTISVQEGNKLFLVGHAVGVQIYSCNGTSWVFIAPRAELYGENGKLVITHGAGPTWEAKDGSEVIGARVAGVTVDATTIPWLLLSATPTSADEEGRLSGTTFIQRIATTGGLPPPASECNASTAGAVREVAYTADYYFWKATGQP